MSAAPLFLEIPVEGDRVVRGTVELPPEGTREAPVLVFVPGFNSAEYFFDGGAHIRTHARIAHTMALCLTGPLTS